MHFLPLSASCYTAHVDSTSSHVGLIFFKSINYEAKKPSAVSPGRSRVPVIGHRPIALWTLRHADIHFGAGGFWGNLSGFRLFRSIYLTNLPSRKCSWSHQKYSKEPLENMRVVSVLAPIVHRPLIPITGICPLLTWPGGTRGLGAGPMINCHQEVSREDSLQSPGQCKQWWQLW